MPSVEGLTPDILWYTLIGIVGIGALVILADKIGDIVHKHRQKSGDTLATELEKQDQRITAVEDGMQVLCKGILALLSHEINGNSIEKLTTAEGEIQKYLVGKIGGNHA